MAAAGSNGLTGGSPMKKPRTWRSASRLMLHPVPVGCRACGPAPCRRPPAAGFLLHQLDDAAAEIVHELEQLVPEGAVAEAWDDGEIEADVEDGAADGAAAYLALEVLRGGHEEFGIVPAGGAGWAWALACGRARRGGLSAFGVGWGGLRLGRGGAGFDEVDVVAGGGAGEQDALQRGGAQEAAVEVGEDGGEVGGAEAGGDGVEVGGGGALADGVDEVAAVGEQDADGVEEDPDVVGQSGGGVILWGIGRGGD